ncbi:MAG: GGDEF domain-containing protein [Casimicrobiaceae bacterium]
MKSFAVDLDVLLSVAAAVLDASGVLLEANAGFLRLLPADCVQPLGSRIARYFIQPAFAVLVAAADSNDGPGYRGRMTIGDPNGRTRTLTGRAWRTDALIRVFAEYDIADLERLTDAMLELNRESSFAHHALASANLTLKQREEEIVEVSLSDELTGVGNRRKLDRALATEVRRVRAGGGSLSAIMIDLDHFKRINDEYGHGAGDLVLARVGALLRKHTRSSDIVTRFGGEEFIVLMPHTGLAQAAFKAEQLRTLLAREVVEPLTHAVTSSFGVAELTNDDDEASFLRRVDAALYRAKESGRNRVVQAA